MVRPQLKSVTSEAAVAKATSSKNVQCPQCGQDFKTKRKLNAHELQAHRGELVSCPKCMAQFATKRTMLVHAASVHSPARVKCLAEGCEVTFSRADNMRSHMRAYHPRATFEGGAEQGRETANDPVPSNAAESDERYVLRHQCNICQKTYSTHSYLVMHINNVHEGAAYKCPKCTKVFNSRGYLHRHFTTMHSKSLQRAEDAATTHIADMPGVVFKCKECNRNFYSQASLVIHRYSMHGVALPDDGK